MPVLFLILLFHSLSCRLQNHSLRLLKICMVIRENKKRTQTTQRKSNLGAYGYFHSFTIATPELAPIRLAPASIIALASAAVLTPPEAFTPISGPTVSRIN